MTEPTKAKQASRPPPIIIQPTSAHTHTFILLHGLGNNGEKFGHELLETGTSSEGKRLTDHFPGAKFIFPTAKWRRSSAFGRAKLTMWFDVYNLEDRFQRRETQVEGLIEESAFIRSIITKEMEVLPQNIILGGLSQGCAMSLMVLLGLDFAIGGYVGMSGWLPYCGDIEDVLSGENAQEQDDGFSFGDEDSSPAEKLDALTLALNLIRDVLNLEEIGAKSAANEPCLSTPVFLGHGAKDEKVAIKLGEEAATALKNLGIDVTWRMYPDLGHWYQIPEEIDDILSFLRGKVGYKGQCK